MLTKDYAGYLLVEINFDHFLTWLEKPKLKNYS
jgi:hypothetical protein